MNSETLVAVDPTVPTLVLTPNNGIGVTINGENAKFNVTTGPLTETYALQVSMDGQSWFNTAYSFGPGSKFKTANFNLQGFGALQFRLNK